MINYKASSVPVSRDHLYRMRRSCVRMRNREIEILTYIADGYSSQEVADILFVSKRTVEFHLSNVFSKLFVNNRIRAVRTAWKYGLLPFEPSASISHNVKDADAAHDVIRLI